MALAAPGSILLRVGRQADAHTHALLSAATQCGPRVAKHVASSLRAGDSVTGVLGLLKEALHGRRLLVADLDSLRTRDDLSKVSAGARLSVYKALRQRADVVMALAGSKLGIEQDPILPSRSEYWDASRIWERCGRDVDRYEAIAALHLTGKMRGSEAPDLEAAVRQLWLSLPASLRELVGVLWVHRRPLPRKLVERAHLAEPKNIDVAIRRHVLHETSAELTLPAYWSAAHDAVSLEEPEVHRRIASALGPLGHDEAFGPLATLEAHRHYAEIPDLVQACKYAEFGVETLLDLGRRMSMAKRWSGAASAYQAVQALGDRTEGHGHVTLTPRARSYAIHYEAYNRYKGGQEPSIDRTIERYREAVAGWVDNALFRSRLVTAYFLAGRISDAVREQARSYAAVPEHDERDHLLTCRTVNRLLERGRTLEASLAWSPKGPPTPLLEETQAELLAAWNESPPSAVWSESVGLIKLRSDVRVDLRRQNRKWLVTLLTQVGTGLRPLDAMCEVVTLLRDELEHTLTTNGEASAGRRTLLVGALALPRTSDDESVRWLAMLAELIRAEQRDEISSRQRAAAMTLWTSLRRRHAGMRRPAVRISDEHTLQLAWSYADRAGFVFHVEIDAEGRYDWYLRDPLRMEGEGSEDPVDDIPSEIIERLEVIAR